MGLIQRLESENDEQQQDQKPDEEKENKSSETKQENDEYSTEQFKDEEDSKKSKASEDEILWEKLQYMMLAYLEQNTSADPSLTFSKNFYVGQWIRDISVEFQTLQSKNADDETFDEESADI